MKEVEKIINPKNAVYREWFSDYDWNNKEKCFLGRKEYGNYLSTYIRNQKRGLILNLNGGWGTGKTFFLKQLYTNLLKDKKSPVVYINAWESDFSNDPLLVIVSELIYQITELCKNESKEKKVERKKTTDEIFSILKFLSKKTYNVGLDVIAAILSKKGKDWGDLDSTALLALFNNIKINDDEKKLVLDEPIFGESLTNGYKKQVKAINQTKISMAAYAEKITSEGGDGKIYVLVDELDRCRPTYAIEFLETIKHLFDIPNFVFVVATDTDQLSHSIKAVYGNDFNGIEYLSRFFNRTATIPQGDYRGLVKGLIKNSNIVESFEKGLMLPSIDSDANPMESKEDFIIKEVTNIAILYDITPRKIDQLIAKFESIVIEAYENEMVVFDFRILLQLLAEYSSDNLHKVYLQRKISTSEVFIVDSDILKDNNLSNNSENFIQSLLPNKDVDLRMNVKGIITTNIDGYFFDKYNSSWMFLLNSYSNYSNEEIINNIVDCFERKIIKKPNNDISGYKNRLYKSVLKSFGYPELIKHDNFSVWSKDTYFRKVEISDSIS